VFIVWIEYCSSVIDRRVVESCVVLCNLCVRKVYVRYEVIFGRVRIVVIDVFKAIFLSFKLVKQPFESDKNLPDSAMATSSAASFKQACSLCKWAQQGDVLINGCPVLRGKATFAYEQPWWLLRQLFAVPPAPRWRCCYVVLLKFEFDIAINRTVELSCAHKGVKIAVLASLHRLNKLTNVR
jgi:hypothetical protein